MNCMSSKRIRHLDETQWHHVYNRGADGQDIFSLGGDHVFFENLIGEALENCDVEIHAFALMSNHFHFLVRDSEGQMSGFMQLLAGRYAAAYNSRTKRHGPLFDGRFGSVPILDERQLLIESRYVERNPLAFVSPPLLPAYGHSSLGVYLGRRRGPAWLTTGDLASRFEGLDYLDFVLSDHNSDIEMRADLPAIRQLTVDQIESAVDQVAPDDRRVARLLHVVVAVERRTATPAELAIRHRVSPAAIRQTARRARVRRDTDPAFERLHRRVQQLLRNAV
jgi:REP element-mobilizing transposase RayT